MRALVLEDFGDLTVRLLPDPVVAAGEVLIRIAVTGICGSDIHGFTGANGRRSRGQVMGHESAGYVAGFGGRVEDSGLRIGQPVTFNPVLIPREHLLKFAGREQHDPQKRVIGVSPDLVSSFAELITVPLRNVVPLPESFPIQRGALIEPLAVALHAVRRAGVEPTDGVLIIGGGPIGQSVVLALLMQNVTRIVVSEVAPARRALVERLGALSIDPSAGSVDGLVAAALGSPADIAIDAVGTSGTIADALAATAPGATVVLVGMGSPRVSLDAFQVSTGERALLGSFTYSAKDFADAAAWAASGEVDLDQLISRIVSLEQAPAAFTALATGDGTPGKVIVRVAEE